MESGYYLSIIVFCTKADAATGWIWRSRKLLDEVTHPTLNLLDITFNRIHTTLKCAYALYLVKPVQQHLAQDSSHPLPETRTLK